MFDRVRQSNDWCSIGFDCRTVRLDRSGVKIISKFVIVVYHNLSGTQLGIRFHKLCKILYLFSTFLFISSISSLKNDVNGVPDTSQYFDEDFAIFSTKIDQLSVSVSIARGLYFEFLFPSAIKRRRPPGQSYILFKFVCCAQCGILFDVWRRSN